MTVFKEPITVQWAEGKLWICGAIQKPQGRMGLLTGNVL
jgi:hypothetical protein